MSETTIKAPKVNHWIFVLKDGKFVFDKRTLEAIDKVYAILEAVEPCGEDNRRELWLKAERGTIDDYDDYERLKDEEVVENYEEFEKMWHDEYPDEISWDHLVTIERNDYRAMFLGRELIYQSRILEEHSSYEYNVEELFVWMLYGGIPLVTTFTTPDQKIAFLKSLFEETYISDIVGRHNIRNKAELEELLNILSSAIGSLTNPEKLSATFQTVKKKKISNSTIKRYIDYLCDAFLIDSAIRYDVKGKRYIDTPVKYYFTDMGLRNARLNFRQIGETHSMENIIFNELKMRGFNVDVGVIVQYGTNDKGNSIRKQLEIDFVCNQGSKRYYIQSAYAIPDQAKMEQEQRSLMLTGDFFKRIIITKDTPAPYYNESGVLIMSVYDFLLNENSLEN